MTKGLPFRPRDWVTRGSDIACVKSVYEDDGKVLLDLVMYDVDGERLGRVSPVMGGPRKFEPACESDEWRRIAKPDFPIPIRWIPNPKGGASMGYDFGKTLPPADWTPKAPKVRMARAPMEDPRLREALEKIADGYNDARGLANEVLGKGKA